MNLSVCREKILARGGHPWKRLPPIRPGRGTEEQPEVARDMHVIRREG